jgi:NAD(P) transhydrogenase
MTCRGTVDQLVDTVFNYPTLSEAYKVAALDVVNKMRAIDRLAPFTAVADLPRQPEARQQDDAPANA